MDEAGKKIEMLDKIKDSKITTDMTLIKVWFDLRNKKYGSKDVKDLAYKGASHSDFAESIYNEMRRRALPTTESELKYIIEEYKKILKSKKI